MNEEIARAHELLKEGAAVLERARNRPTIDPIEEYAEGGTVVVPVERRVPPVDHRAMAVEIARDEATALVEVLAGVLKPRLKAQKDRIKSLEDEVAALKLRLDFPTEMQKALGGTAANNSGDGLDTAAQPKFS